MENTNLLNEIFNPEQIEIIMVNQRYLKIFGITVFFLIVSLFLLSKNYYYENVMIIKDDKVLLVVDKKIINDITKKSKIIVNDISSNYSINNIISDGDICYIDIKLETNIINNQNMKYKIFLRKERMIEYFIRIIKTN